MDDTANLPLADAYGIVMGSSHTGALRYFIPHLLQLLGLSSVVNKKVLVLTVKSQ